MTTADVTTTDLTTDRIGRAKTAYSVRRVDLKRPLTAVAGPNVRPRHGDLVLAAVVEVGQHKALELGTSRRAALYPGDDIVVGYGARYAPDQFEAELPEDLGACDLVAAGGCAARVRSRNSAMKPPTRIAPVGLLATADGRVLNVADGALLPPTRSITRRTTTVLVAGTSMNSGKTTTVASLVHGLTRTGMRVGACKITGTGAGGDRNLFADAGAAEVLDFTDLGLVATYRVPVPRLAQVTADMHDHLRARGVEVIIMEIADGVLQAETCALLGHPALTERVDGAVFAATDAAGALLGVTRMRRCGQRVRAVSGVLTASPLAVREAQDWLDVPVHGPHDLCDPLIATSILHRVATPVSADAGRLTVVAGA